VVPAERPQVPAERRFFSWTLCLYRFWRSSIFISVGAEDSLIEGIAVGACKLSLRSVEG
jgi:hypothetical protein